MRKIALIIGAGIADVAFADDRAENIEGSRRLGMNGIVFKDAKQYERELRELLK